MTKQQIIRAAALTLSIALCIYLIALGYESLRVSSSETTSLHRFTKYVGSLAYIGLVSVYVIWLVQVKQPNSAVNFFKLLRQSALFLAIAYISYPITKDVYLYLQYGWMSLNGVNPYINGAGDFASALTPLLDWKQSSTYGPLSLPSFALAAVLTPINLILGVYFFKLLCLLFHVLNGYLIWKSLNTHQHRDKITLAYLLNPALLFEQVVNAHIDVLICTVLIILDQCLKHRYYLSALLVTLAGFFTKTLPIIWLPLEIIFLIKYRRWKTIALFSLVSLAIFSILHFTVLPTAAAWKSLLNAGVGERTAGSLHNVLAASTNSFQQFLPSGQLSSSFKLVTYSAFAVYYSLTLFRIYWKRDNSKSQLMLEIGWLTLILFVFATPWYQPWYATILLPIAALNSHARFFVLVSSVFCLSGTVAYFCLGFDQSLRGVLGSLLTMGLPISALVLRPRIQRFMLQNVE